MRHSAADAVLQIVLGLILLLAVILTLHYGSV